MICQKNFYENTTAVFKGCKIPKREPDYISYNRFSGEVSSRYWYTKSGVIRASDHWSEYRTFNDGRKNKYMQEAYNISSTSVHYKDKIFNNEAKKSSKNSNDNFFGCGNIASCRWKLKTNNKHIKDAFFYNDVEMAGYCDWERFSTI